MFNKLFRYHHTISIQDLKKLSQHTLTSATFLFLCSGCALLTDTLSATKPEPQRSKATPVAQAESEKVLIYVYPKTGPVANGQYYQIPLDTERSHTDEQLVKRTHPSATELPLRTRRRQ